MKEEVTICGIPHTIEYIDRAEDNNMGEWVEKKQKILIDSSMGTGVQHHTLLHEMLHAILHMQGDSVLGEDENFINRLATSLMNSSFRIITNRG